MTDSSQKDKDETTVGGYKPEELLRAPLEPPDPEEVGKRSPLTDDSE